MRLQNLDGLVFTTPFKQAACALAGALSVQAREVGPSMPWHGALTANGSATFSTGWDVSKHSTRDYSFIDRRIMLIGAGGAGRAIAVAIAHAGPRRCRSSMSRRAAQRGWPKKLPSIRRTSMHASASRRRGRRHPAECLAGWNAERSRMPIEVARLPSELIVFDASSSRS